MPTEHTEYTEFLTTDYADNTDKDIMHIIQRYDTMNDCSPIAELLELIDRKSKLFMSAHLGYGRVEYVNRGRAGNPLTPAMREQLRSRVQHEVLACTRPGTLERKRLLERIASEFGVHYQTVIKHTADLRAAGKCEVGMPKSECPSR